MPDPRVEAYADLLVERCIDVQPRQQVLLASSPLAKPLNDALTRRIARRGAYAIPRINYDGSVLVDRVWLAEAPEELLAELPPIVRHLVDEIDAVIGVHAPENTRAGTAIDAARLALAQKAGRPMMERIVAAEIPWVSCQFPTNALAQEAGMSLGAFEDFLYGACLIDWDAEGERMRRLAERLDAADELRIVADGTDLTLSLAGRAGKVADGRTNMPDGEVFYCPVEDSADGVVHFSEFPAVNQGREIRGIRLRFEGGRIVEASAETEEEFLLEVLDTDKGARRLGEVGIGCNPGITRYMKNTLFDEKMNGTVHLAVGQGFTELGGTNESAVHWDIVKDLRAGGRLYADGALIQEDGAWKL
jgi:aminopeptidase